MSMKPKAIMPMPFTHTMIFSPWAQEAELIGRSFLDDTVKSQYLSEYQKKLRSFAYLFKANQEKA